MQQSKSSKNLSHYCGTIAFLCLITSSNLVTTIASYESITIFRIFCACVVALSLAVSFVERGRFSTQQIFAILVFALVSVYACVSALTKSVVVFGPNSLLMDVLIISAGIYFVSRWGSLVKVRDIAQFFAIYAVTAVIWMLAIGGLKVAPIPHFNIEYGSINIGRTEDYSLGLSFFFGLSAVASANILAETPGFFVRLMMGILTLIFIALCLLGGGRGEVIATLLVTSVTLVSLKRLFVPIGLSFVLLFTYFFLDSINLLESFVVVERFLLLFDGDLSSRDLLLRDALELLRDNPQCLLIGCGAGFFQHFYGYGVGYYPHNSVAEAIITFGFPAVLLVSAFVVLGSYRYLRKTGRPDFMFGLFLYVFIVSLKSQSLFGSWLLLILVTTLIWNGVAGGTFKIEHSSRIRKAR